MVLRKVERDLLRVDEVAARLDCNPESVRRLIRRGELPAVRLGSSDRAPFRVDRGELDRWLHEYPFHTRAVSTPLGPQVAEAALLGGLGPDDEAEPSERTEDTA
jgi:excisionase family DNA binding protein